MPKTKEVEAPTVAARDVTGWTLLFDPSLDPTEDDLRDPQFLAVWDAIKGWDIQREPRQGYAGATGTDVMTILRAIRKPNVLARNPSRDRHGSERLSRPHSPTHPDSQREG